MKSKKLIMMLLFLLFISIIGAVSAASYTSDDSDATINKISHTSTSKNIKITVTLNKKVKNEYVYVILNGKSYKAKTNSNGIATITISELQKITGKTVKYTVVYGQSMKNKSIKIKKTNPKTTKFKMVVKNRHSKTKTTTVKIYKQMDWKKLHKHDGVGVVYQTYDAQYPAGLSISADYDEGQNIAKHLRLVKAKAYYKKNGKTFKRVKKSKDGGYTIDFSLISYKPYKVKIYYKIK